MTDSPDDVPLETDCLDVKSRLDGNESFLLLDCREADEYAQVRIEGSRLLPMSELAERARELDQYRDSPIVVYCHVGGRSLQVVAWLRKQGFRHAQSMAGGIDAWAQDIDPSLARY